MFKCIMKYYKRYWFQNNNGNNLCVDVGGNDDDDINDKSFDKKNNEIAVMSGQNKPFQR